MKKRLLSAFLVLAMVLTLLPSAALAVEQKDDYLDGVSLNVGTPRNYLHMDALSAGTFTATVGETVSYQRLPRLTSYCPRCYNVVLDAIPEYYMVPQVGSYSLTKTGVIDNCSFSLAYSKSMRGYPCLQFNYDAVSAGTTQVELTIYYNFNDPGIAGTDYKACGTCGQWITVNSNRNWYKQTIHFTVVVQDPKPTEPVTVTKALTSVVRDEKTVDLANPVSNTVLYEGDQVTWTIQVTNNTDTQKTYYITDLLTYDGIEAGSAEMTYQGNVINPGINNGNITVGGKQTATLTAAYTVAPGTYGGEGGNLTNTVEIRNQPGTESVANASATNPVGYTVKVNYDGNGGTADGAPVKTELVRQATDPSTSPVSYPVKSDAFGFTRAGYAFDGWYTAAEGGTEVTGETRSLPGGATYFAHWNALITGFTKVRLTEAPADVDLTLNGATVNYEDSVVIPDGEEVTLLYKLTVTGTPDAKFKITDTGARVVGSNCGASGTDEIFGTIPAGGSAEIYVVKNFDGDDIENGKLTNEASIEADTGSQLDEELTEDPSVTDDGTSASEKEPEPSELGWPIQVSFCDPETGAAIGDTQTVQKDGTATPPTSDGDKKITGWTLDTAGQTAYDSKTFTYSELAELVDEADGWNDVYKEGNLIFYAVYGEEEPEPEQATLKVVFVDEETGLEVEGGTDSVTVPADNQTVMLSELTPPTGYVLSEYNTDPTTAKDGKFTIFVKQNRTFAVSYQINNTEGYFDGLEGVESYTVTMTEQNYTDYSILKPIPSEEQSAWSIPKRIFSCSSLGAVRRTQAVTTLSSPMGRSPTEASS